VPQLIHMIENVTGKFHNIIKNLSGKLQKLIKCRGSCCVMTQVQMDFPGGWGGAESRDGQQSAF